MSVLELGLGSGLELLVFSRSRLCLLYENNNKLLFEMVSIATNGTDRFASFSYICCIFSHQASALCYCSRELKRNSEKAYISYLDPQSSIDMPHQLMSVRTNQKAAPAGKKMRPFVRTKNAIDLIDLDLLCLSTCRCTERP